MSKEKYAKEVPGVAFSGGQSEVEATKNLNAINKINSHLLISHFLVSSFAAVSLENLGKINERYKQDPESF